MATLAVVAGYLFFAWAFFLCGIRVQLRWWQIREGSHAPWTDTLVDVLALTLSCALPWLVHQAYYVQQQDPGLYLLSALLWANLVQAWTKRARTRLSR